MITAVVEVTTKFIFISGSGASEWAELVSIGDEGEGDGLEKKV